MDPVSIHPDSARKLARQMRLLERQATPYPKRARGERMFLPFGGASAVALTTSVIPGRVDETPGGPVSVVIQDSVDGADFAPGDTVEVYSWVKTDSPDPTDSDWSGYIYISKAQGGEWWYHAIDCVEPPPAFEGIGSGDTIGVGNDGETTVYYVGD